MYVGLERRGEFWEAISLGGTQPQGLFIRGKVLVLQQTRDRLSIEYGIESYFVPEGKGRVLEASRKPLVVEAAVGRDGTAVIRRVLVDGVPLP